ncbi:MAG: hypothetical protein V7700_17325 [Halioglobus sp.]
MKEVFLEATEESAVEFFSRGISGAVTMLNLLCFRDVADYSASPALKPGSETSGREAFQKYIDHTLPFLHDTGGDIQFLGGGGKFFVGPQNERWDVVMLIRQNSMADFFNFASNEDYLSGIGHRTAALTDSRLLPLLELSGKSIVGEIT